MNRILLGTGNLSWDANERRTDRYGSVRLTQNNEPQDILFSPEVFNLEGKKGRLLAKVIKPVKSPHMGDIARGIRPTTPNQDEEVLFGTGTLFVERKGEAPREPAKHEMIDKQLMEAVFQSMKQAGVNTTIQHNNNPEPVYDIIGLKPDDDRDTDWLDPNAFYRTHLSQVELYFEPTE